MSAKVEIRIRYDGSELPVFPRWAAWHGMGIVAQAYTRRGVERRARRYVRRIEKRPEYFLDSERD